LFFRNIILGEHRIQIDEQKFITIDETFELTEEQNFLQLNYPLEYKKFVLNFSGAPNNAEVNIDGKRVGKLPLRDLKMNFGEYNLKVSKPGFYKYEKNIILNKEQPYNFNIKLDPKSKGIATLLSAFIPGSGQFYSDREMTGIILGAASIGAAISGFYLHNQYKDKKDLYFVNKDNYEQNIDLTRMTSLYSTLKDSHKGMEDTYNTSRIILGIAATIWIYNIVDSYIFFPKQGTINTNVSANENSGNLSININF